jgi:glycosyltransferase involved in cell wall biosynthesis
MAEPIRIMNIIARLNIGGPAVYVILLTEQFGPPDFDSRLVCGQIGPQEGDMAYLARERGITPILIPDLGRELSPLRDMKTLVALWRLMRQYRPHVVHTHTAKAGFVGRIAAWLARVPVRVHTFHGHVLRGYFGPAKTRFFLWLERFTGRLTDRLITISPALRDELVNTYRVAPAEKFEVVPLGLDLSRYARMLRHEGQFRARYGIPPGALLVGIVGRLVPIKNHDLFLQMAERLRHTLPDAHFVIVGDGEQRAELESLVDALGLREYVTFTGWEVDLAPIYSDLDALVVTSDNEGTPVSLIEGLAACVPVVSTAVGGVPDLLRGGAYGRLVPPGDVAALAAAVGACLAEPQDQHDQREEIRRAIVAQYDIARLSHDLAALYRQLLAAKRSRP